MAPLTLEVSHSGQVATIAIVPHERLAGGAGARPNRHRELAEVFERLRADDGVRVVVLTGAGSTFAIPRAPDAYDGRPAPDPARDWATFSAIPRCHQAMAEMEKPIVARVNGHAIGFGQSLALACDLIVASTGVVFMDHHMNGVFRGVDADGVPVTAGHDFSSVPGDGGAALLPLFMSPALAKEALMLARAFTAEEYARLGVINRVVAPDELDATVDDLVAQLLHRAAQPLAWTKRLVNRVVADQLNRTLDAGVGYEMVGFHHRELLGRTDKKSLD